MLKFNLYNRQLSFLLVLSQEVTNCQDSHIFDYETINLSRQNIISINIHILWFFIIYSVSLTYRLIEWLRKYDKLNCDCWFEHHYTASCFKRYPLGSKWRLKGKANGRNLKSQPFFRFWWSHQVVIATIRLYCFSFLGWWKPMGNLCSSNMPFSYTNLVKNGYTYVTLSKKKQDINLLLILFVF